MFNDTKARDYMEIMREVCGTKELILVYDPKNFSIDFIREFKDKVNWAFNCGPYSKEVLKEFGINNDRRLYS